MHLSSVAVGLTLVADVAMAQNAVRLGAPVAVSREEFSSVSGVVELSGNRALVGDDKENRLVIVDFGAQSARTIGRRGTGPGEYRVIGSLFARSSGGAYLADFAQRRLLPVNDDGTFGNTISYPPSMMLVGIDSRDVFYGESFLPRRGAIPNDSLWVVRWDAKGERIDTLLKYNAMMSAFAGPPGITRPAFPAHDTWSPLPAGDLMFVRGAPYSASVWRSGQFSPPSHIPSPQVRFTDAERRAFEREMATQPVKVMGGSGSAPSAPSRMTFVFPNNYPPFGGDGMGGRYMLVSQGGHAWLRRLRARSDSLALYDVIDARSGALVARVELGVRELLVGFGHTSVYTATRDTDDIATLRRYAYPVFPPG